MLKPKLAEIQTKEAAEKLLQQLWHKIVNADKHGQLRFPVGYVEHPHWYTTHEQITMQVFKDAGFGINIVARDVPGTYWVDSEETEHCQSVYLMYVTWNKGDI